MNKGSTSAWWDNFLRNEVPLSEWKDNFRMCRFSWIFVIYQELFLRRKETQMRQPISVETQVAAFLYYISDEGRYRKTANAFGISRSSVTLIVKKGFLWNCEANGSGFRKTPANKERCRTFGVKNIGNTWIPSMTMYWGKKRHFFWNKTAIEHFCDSINRKR